MPLANTKERKRLQLASPAWLEPDLCVLEEWEAFRSSLVQLVSTGGGQRSTIICGLPDAARRTFERDLRVAQRENASPVHMLTRSADLKLDVLPGLLAARIADAPPDEPLGVCFFHDMAWTAERYTIDEIVEYQQQMAALRRDYPIQMVHLYPPTSFDSKALWYCTRIHRAIWTGESPCENFYYMPRPAPPSFEGFSFEEDLKRCLGFLQRQTRMRAELVGRVVETESLLEERVAELHALNRLARILAHSQDLDEILREALGRVIEMLGMDAGGIYVFGDEGASETRHQALLPVKPFSDKALTTFHEAVQRQSPGGRIWWTSDVSDTNDAFLPTGSPVRSFLVAPLKFSGETVGVLEVVGSEAHAFSLQEIHLVDVIGGQIGVAVKNARLHEKHLQAETAELNLRQQLLDREHRAPSDEIVDGVLGRVEIALAAAQDSLAVVLATRADDAVGERVEAARSDLSRIGRLLEEFQALGGGGLASASVELDVVLGTCLERRRLALDEAAVDVQVQSAQGVPPITADAGDLERLFLTLLDQAVAAGGKKVVISLDLEGREAVVTVEDDGTPFAASDVAHAFEPFRPVRGTLVGEGLALAGCARIVKRHGATIEVQRSAEKTRFIVRFPVTVERKPSASGGKRGASDDLAQSGIR